MPKRTERGNALFHVLDDLLAVRRHLERENLPAQRMQMSCGNLETSLGAVPFIVQTPFPAIVQPRADIERAAFAQFGAEMPWPEDRCGLLGSLQARVDAPIVYLAEAFVRVVMDSDACIVTVGTQGKPGWTNQNCFAPSAFDYLASMAGIGGLLVDFACPFDRRFEPPEPENERAITWAHIRRQGVGERALAMAKRPRERKSTPSGRSMRMGARAIEASIVRYAERALKAMPAVSTAKESPALPARPPMFWIANIAYHRTSGK